MKRFYLLSVIFGLFNFQGFSQNEVLHCGADEMTYQIVQQRPDLLPKFEANRATLNNFTQNFHEVTAKSDPYIIPVVFHIIHENGAENISNEQIYDAIKILNEHYNKQNADTSEIIPEFKNIAANVGVEFHLAKKDPQGNCTNGITRTYSTLTEIGEHQVKDLIHWPSHQYLNIYVCKDAAGLAGHALMPDVADTIPEWDGIVIRSDYVGTIGTSQWLHRVTLTHEVGHYLNLFHIWGGNNVPGFYYLPVANPGNCAYDDEVSDTPLTIGWQTCNLSGSSCGSLDNVQNFMEYSYCSYMFTEGQKARIIAALNSPIAQRNNLWSESNLIATGLLDNAELCHVDFEAERPYVCVGEELIIRDRSYSKVTQRTWAISGGTIISQQDEILKVVFNQEGRYDISLTVSDGVNDLSLTKSNYIEVLPSSVTQNYLTERFEYPEAPKRSVLLNDDNLWQFSDYAATGEHGYWTNNFEQPYNIYSFDLRPINLSQVNQPYVIFDRALKTISGSPMELLEIKASNDCGVTWKTMRSFTSSSLASNGTISSGPYVPTEEDWKSITSFQISNAYAKEHTMLRFSFNGKGYNDLYIDNLFIGEKNQLSAEDLESKTEWMIYPNPSNGILHISNTQNKALKITIMDLTGKVNYESSVEEINDDYTLPIHIVSGTYLIKVQSEESMQIEKLVVE